MGVLEKWDFRVAKLRAPLQIRCLEQRAHPVEVSTVVIPAVGEAGKMLAPSPGGDGERVGGDERE